MNYNLYSMEEVTNLSFWHLFVCKEFHLSFVCLISSAILENVFGYAKKYATSGFIHARVLFDYLLLTIKVDFFFKIVWE